MLENDVRMRIQSISEIKEHSPIEMSNPGFESYQLHFVG